MKILTKKQKRLIEEIEEIQNNWDFNYKDIDDVEGYEKTIHLELVKDKFIRSIIINEYTFIDESLNMLICDYFFKDKDYTRLWRTKKFQNFNYYILEKIYIIQKLDLVRAFKKIPKKVVSIIHNINSVRNGLVHSFFPENLRKNKPIYKGNSIFSIEGMKKFHKDIGELHKYFYKVVLGIKE